MSYYLSINKIDQKTTTITTRNLEKNKMLQWKLEGNYGNNIKEWNNCILYTFMSMCENYIQLVIKYCGFFTAKANKVGHISRIYCPL